MPQKQIHLTPAERQRAYRERVKQRYLDLNVYKRPPALDPAQAQAPTKKWNNLLQAAYEALAVVVTERQTYAAARTEKWQESEKADEFEAETEELNELMETLQEHLPEWPRTAKEIYTGNLEIEHPF